MSIARWLIIVIPLVFSVAILLLIFIRLVLFKKLNLKTVKLGLLGIVIVYFLQLLGKLIWTYFALRGSTLGAYLLQDHAYLKDTLLRLAYPFGESLLVALIMVFLAYLGLRFYPRPILEKIDLYLIFIASFIVGYPSVFVLLFGSFILMVLIQAGSLVFKKASDRLSLSPYLIVGAIIIGVLSNFNFYWQFLGKIKLL